MNLTRHFPASDIGFIHAMVSKLTGSLHFEVQAPHAPTSNATNTPTRLWSAFSDQLHQYALTHYWNPQQESLIRVYGWVLLDQLLDQPTELAELYQPNLAELHLFNAAVA